MEGWMDARSQGRTEGGVGGSRVVGFMDEGMAVEMGG